MLSKQVNYNRVEVKCQIYKNAIFKIIIAKISKYGIFKFKDFSRTFKGLEFFFKIPGLLKDPMNPV